MAIPFVPLLKLIALGSLKLIFLLFGAVFFPILALQFILGGASSMLMPTLDWLEQESRLEPARHQAIVEDLNALSEIEFSREEARQLLWKLTKKTIANMGQMTMSAVNALLKLLRLKA